MKQLTIFIFNWTCLQILKARLKIISKINYNPPELNLQVCFYIIYFITSVKVDFKWHVGANVRILVKLFFFCRNETFGNLMAIPAVATRGCRVTVYRHEQLAARARGCSVEFEPRDRRRGGRSTGALKSSRKPQLKWSGACLLHVDRPRRQR